MTETNIITFDDLKEEGWYWMADTSDCDANWAIAWVSGEAASGEEGSEDYSEASWASSFDADSFEEYELSKDYVFLGPVSPPEVAIPIAVPRVPKVFESVPLPPLVEISTLPSLTKIK